jgi:hypothetical protein
MAVKASFSDPLLEARFVDVATEAEAEVWTCVGDEAEGRLWMRFVTRGCRRLLRCLRGGLGPAGSN